MSHLNSKSTSCLGYTQLRSQRELRMFKTHPFDIAFVNRNYDNVRISLSQHLHGKPRSVVRPILVFCSFSNKSIAKPSHLTAEDIQVASRLILMQRTASVQSVGVQHEMLPRSSRDEADALFLCLHPHAVERTNQAQMIPRFRGNLFRSHGQCHGT
jgi:hypothetical protein